MVSPAPGFTARVMARLEARERAQARRRAVIGAGLLVVAASALLAFVGMALASWLSVVMERPSTIVSLVVALSPVADRLLALLEALWVAAIALARSVDSVAMLAYALAVLAFTLLWARVALGSFQLTSDKMTLGGLR
jgi:hypothetical protein